MCSETGLTAWFLVLAAAAPQAWLAEPSPGPQQAALAGAVGAPNPRSRPDPGGGNSPTASAGPRTLANSAAPAVRHRKAIAVIADFADYALEDWTGVGIRSEADLAVQLRRMEEHWRWLCSGREDLTWDIVRITLPVGRSASAYPDFDQYRTAVGQRVRQAVDVHVYDADGDDVVDSAWVIAASGGGQFAYLVGGTSRQAGVNLFVDSQDSVSVVAGATGNFNHELGHTRGLPDLYGACDTLHYLTVMSDSWALPPQDFTAYERIQLGWARPEALGGGPQWVALPMARHAMAALRIDTVRPCEYFLIEYRRRPDTGFGSQAPPYDGLAIYHVLQGTNQGADPPLMKLEPADGDLAAGAPPTSADFLFPGNAQMRLPLVLRSYFGGEEVFRVEAVRATRHGTLAALLRRAHQAAAGNLLVNASFEDGTGMPSGWQTQAWAPTARFAWDAAQARDGVRSASIDLPTENDAAWTQSVSGLVPGRSYRLSGWLKGDRIVTVPGGIGASVCLMGTWTASWPVLTGTFDWQEAAVIFPASATTVVVAARLGYWASTATGRVWCDALRLEALRSAFAPPPSYTAYGSGCAGSSGTPTLAASGTSLPIAGQPFVVQVTGLPPTAPALLLLGASRTQWGAVPLPLDLTPLGLPGCTLLTSVDAAFAITNVLGFGTWGADLPLTVAGQRFYQQVLVLDPGANPSGWILSNGGEAVVGF